MSDRLPYPCLASGHLPPPKKTIAAFYLMLSNADGPFCGSGANRVREDLAPSHDLVCSGLDSKGQCETNGILLAGDHVTGG